MAEIYRDRPAQATEEEKGEAIVVHNIEELCEDYLDELRKLHGDLAEGAVEYGEDDGGADAINCAVAIFKALFPTPAPGNGRRATNWVERGVYAYTGAFYFRNIKPAEVRPIRQQFEKSEKR